MDKHNQTIYVYDDVTGKIKYTINEITLRQVESFKERGIPVFVGGPNHRITGTFVKKDQNTGVPYGIDTVQHMDFIQINKHVVVANGTDEVILSGLKNGMNVNVNDEYSYVVDDETGNTLEISANGFSYNQKNNAMVVKFKGYGYHDSKITISLVEGD